MSEIKVRVAARTLQHVQSRVRTHADCFQRFCAHFGRKSPTITVDVLPIYSVDRLHFRHEMVDSRTPNQRPSPKLFFSYWLRSYKLYCEVSAINEKKYDQLSMTFSLCMLRKRLNRMVYRTETILISAKQKKKEKKNEVKPAIKNSGKTKNGTTWFVARHFSQPPKALNLSNWLYKNKQKAIDLTAVNCLRQLPFRTASLNSHPPPSATRQTTRWFNRFRGLEPHILFFCFVFLNHEPPSTFPLQRRLWISMRNI